jgi:hypothetical protein
VGLSSKSFSAPYGVRAGGRKVEHWLKFMLAHTGTFGGEMGRDWRAILAVGAVSGTMQEQRFGTPDKELFGEDSRSYGRFS